MEPQRTALSHTQAENNQDKSTDQCKVDFCRDKRILSTPYVLPGRTAGRAASAFFPSIASGVPTLSGWRAGT
jgi:hypothetical protein